MKRKVLLILTLSFLVLSVFTVSAFAQSKAGTSAAPELLIPLGAPEVAMSGAVVSFVSGPSAIPWNPAGLDVGDASAGALFSHRSYIGDIGINYVAVAAKISSFGTLGLTLRSFNIGQISVTTEEQPDGTGAVINPTFFTLGLTYSKLLTDHVGIGATMNIVNESFANVSASGIAFDAGIQYRNLGEIAGLSLGVCVNNIGTSMQYGGSDLWLPATATNLSRGITYYKVEAVSSQMPSIIQIGLGYDMKLDENTGLKLGIAYENNNYGIDEYRLGAEVGLVKSLFIRGGYVYSTDPTGAKSIFQNYTFGLGVDLKEYVGVPISIDYAYIPVQYFSTNSIFDIHINF
jgi:hypothetical protein